MPKESKSPIIDLITELVRDLKEAMTSHHTKEIRQLRHLLEGWMQETKQNNQKLTMVLDQLQESVTSLQTVTQEGLANLTTAVDSAVLEIGSQFPGDPSLLALKGTIDAVASSIQTSLASATQRLNDAVAAAPANPVP